LDHEVQPGPTGCLPPTRRRRTREGRQLSAGGKGGWGSWRWRTLNRMRRLLLKIRITAILYLERLTDHAFTPCLRGAHRKISAGLSVEHEKSRGASPAFLAE